MIARSLRNMFKHGAVGAICTEVRRVEHGSEAGVSKPTNTWLTLKDSNLKQ